MKKLIAILWTEPVVILAIVVGVVSVLAKEGILAGWIPLLVLAIATPIQRALVLPEQKLRRLAPIVKRELGL